MMEVLFVLMVMTIVALAHPKKTAGLLRKAADRVEHVTDYAVGEEVDEKPKRTPARGPSVNSRHDAKRSPLYRIKRKSDADYFVERMTPDGMLMSDEGAAQLEEWLQCGETQWPVEGAREIRAFYHKHANKLCPFKVDGKEWGEQ